MDDACPRGWTGSAPASTTARGPSRLTDEQLARYPPCCSAAPKPMASGGNSGPAAALPPSFELEFGVSYHPRHVGRLCKAMRWSPQKPARRARQRDEAAIAQWREETWPAIKKGRRPKGKPSSS